MTLAVGLRRNSRWPKKKNVNRKKKILATKAEASGFFRISCQDFHVSWYREVLHLLQVVRFFFASKELLYLRTFALIVYAHPYCARNS